MNCPRIRSPRYIACLIRKVDVSFRFLFFVTDSSHPLTATTVTGKKDERAEAITRPQFVTWSSWKKKTFYLRSRLRGVGVLSRALTRFNSYGKLMINRVSGDGDGSSRFSPPVHPRHRLFA